MGIARQQWRCQRFFTGSFLACRKDVHPSYDNVSHSANEFNHRGDIRWQPDRLWLDKHRIMLGSQHLFPFAPNQGCFDNSGDCDSQYLLAPP